MKFLILLTAAAVGWAAEKPVSMKDLPPAVQRTIEEQSRGAEIKGLSMETEDGKTRYEVETIVNGKRRDIAIDPRGVVVEVEDEVAAASVPPPVRAAVARKAVGGRIIAVESVTAGHALVAYEAEYVDKNGRKREARFKPDGTEIKD